MIQELADLKQHILDGRYQEALLLIDELDGMSRKAILRAIKSFLIRILIDLIKNQVENRLTNSWAASIRDSICQIKDLNLQDNNTSYYVKVDEWDSLLEPAVQAAISHATVEVSEGIYTPSQLKQLINQDSLSTITKELLDLTYQYSDHDLPDKVNEYFGTLPGGERWI